MARMAQQLDMKKAVSDNGLYLCHLCKMMFGAVFIQSDFGSTP